MKLVIVFIVFLTGALQLFAKGGEPDTEALYIVPTPTDLVPHSRFIVQIVEPFRGPETQKISYVFPEALIGQADRKIEFSRIAGTENSWVSDELTAHCTIIDEFFSCNIYVNQDQIFTQDPWPLRWIMPTAQAALRKICSGVFAPGVVGSVQEQFCSNEPAGILSYEFQ